jgi:dolichol-phosphate mannosyltransferase
VFVGFLAVFLRGGVLALVLKAAPWTIAIAIIPAAVVAAAIVFSGQAYIAIVQPSTPAGRRRGHHLLLAGAVLYLVSLRLVYIGVPELIPEETYYWNYAQHLDWGYLDHPPMVAWIIGFGSALFGSTEFGVRIGAFCCWFVTAAFAFAFARDLFDRTAAVRTVLLVTALPFFFGIGLVATPDAALTAAWAGALFFLGRALLGGRPFAWLGAGICIGVGLLSKYTAALLVPAAVLFMLSDGEARRWWARPQPYLAAALAGLLFLPVIYWNSQHEWASFLFQTAGRLRETAHFSPHELLGAALFLLTPTGLLAVIVTLLRRLAAGDSRWSHAEWEKRRHRFIVLFTLTPLVVFAIFSLSHHTKLNWTGPTWLAVLPAMAAMMAPTTVVSVRKAAAIVRRSWMPTIATVTVLYGGLLHYLVLGFPGVLYPAIIADITGWKDLQRQVAAVEDRVTAATGRAPLVVGMDRYNISSELAFYGYPDGPRRTAGRHLFGEVGLMYRYWFPEEAQVGRNVVLVGRRGSQLGTDNVVSRFDSLGAVVPIPVSWNGQILREYYYRIGYGYRAPVGE